VPVRREGGRPNVFGSIAAENLGYAKVELRETIAMGHPGCRVIVHLRPTAAAEAAHGREYFGADDGEYGQDGHDGEDAGREAGRGDGVSGTR
jgi:hypothetical protein